MTSQYFNAADNFFLNYFYLKAGDKQNAAFKCLNYAALKKKLL